MSSNETVTTIETTLEVKLHRTETVTRITCMQCPATAEVRKIEITPPSAIGKAVEYQRAPDGWWIHGSSFFSIKATCPSCFGKPFVGVPGPDHQGSLATVVPPSSEPSTLADEVRKAVRAALRADSPERAPTPFHAASVWQSTLSTPGGAGAVARALALHLRDTLALRGPRATAAENIRRGASLLRIAETLEACGARLEAFKPEGASDIDLKPLGVEPFADPGGHLHCSFCAKDQKDVKKLIAGPASYICNECVALSQSIIDESSPADAPVTESAEALLERIDRVCRAAGGYVAVSAMERAREVVGRHAAVRMSNADGVEINTRAEGATVTLALQAALSKAGH